MGNAYGFMEITGVVAATDALDIMCKAADVSLHFEILHSPDSNKVPF